jgi:hypothetical protein
MADFKRSVDRMTRPEFSRLISAADRSLKEIHMKRFVIERDIPGAGTLEREQLREAAQKSNSVLHELGPDIQWVHSYVTQDRIYCVYLATDAALIRKHAEMSGFPASKVTEVKRVIDPSTAAPDAR